ncbi:hypothetical protein GIB67_035676 [Kingdonia uniflora]|uniref:Uncharacterized protein n=1 Tax=Kingdonia uniflora TaxID=39325 RepID=A0A7J7MIN6_9MAGN|nr:hypothetical protein GIB67_035676 [Kingdonia uniflora]
MDLSLLHFSRLKCYIRFLNLQAEIKSNVEKNPESKHYDVDDDPIGQAYGPKKKGRVRGEGILVTKSMLKHMKHARTIIKEGKLAYKEINNKLNVVIDEVKTLKENATREGQRMQNASPYHTSNYVVLVDLVTDEDAEVSGRRGMFFRDIPVGEWYKYPSFLLKIIDKDLLAYSNLPSETIGILDRDATNRCNEILYCTSEHSSKGCTSEMNLQADPEISENGWKRCFSENGWKDKIDNTEHLNAMDKSLRSSLNHIQTHKENFNKQQLVSLECNNQLQNGMHLPLVMDGAQQGQPISWIPDNDREHMMLSEDPNLLPRRYLGYYVIYPEVDIREAQRYLKEMKLALQTASNSDSKITVSPYSLESSIHKMPSSFPPNQDALSDTPGYCQNRSSLHQPAGSYTSSQQDNILVEERVLRRRSQRRLGLPSWGGVLEHPQQHDTLIVLERGEAAMEQSLLSGESSNNNTHRHSDNHHNHKEYLRRSGAIAYSDPYQRAAALMDLAEDDIGLPDQVHDEFSFADAAIIYFMVIRFDKL